MSTLLPVRLFTLPELREARGRIEGVIARTPLIRLEVAGVTQRIWLKLESLQPINAFKIRGAANAVAVMPEQERRKGVWTISAGNAGQGVAYAAREAGIPCTVVVIDTAPDTKVDRMSRLGARLVKAPFDACWRAMEHREFPGVEGTFVHPFDDHDFVVGNGTMAFEILEDLPEVDTVVTAFGGGGLVSGVGRGMKLLKPDVEVWTAEPETAAPFVRSFEMDSPQEFPAWKASWVDGAGGKSVFPRMWERVRPVVDGAVIVTLEETRLALKTMAETTRIIAEGAGALPVAALLNGRIPGENVVAVVSGGNIDMKLFAELVG